SGEKSSPKKYGERKAQQQTKGHKALEDHINSDQFTPEDRQRIVASLREQTCCQENDSPDACADCASHCALRTAINRGAGIAYPLNSDGTSSPEQRMGKASLRRELPASARAALQKESPQVREATARIYGEDKPRQDEPPSIARAIPVQDEEARDAMRILDEEREDAGRPEPRTWEEVEIEVDRRLRENGADAERDRLSKSGATSDVDMRTVARLLAQDGTQALRTKDPEQIAAWAKMADRYRDDRADIARALAIGRDRFESQEERNSHYLAKSFLRPRKETEVALDRARAAGDVEQQGVLWQRYKAELAELMAKLEAAGIDLSNLDMTNVEKTQEAMRAKRSLDAGAFDALYEYWINSILSGPQTHLANIMGTGYAVWEATTVRTAEALVNSAQSVVTGHSIEGAPDLGELRYAWAGMGNSVSKAVHNAVTSFRSERPTFELQFTENPETKLEQGFQPGAIDGWEGRVIRIPSRVLLATDEFFKTLMWHGMVGGFAYRAARDRGLKGDAMTQAVREEVDNPRSESGFKALAWARDKVFQDREALRKTPWLGTMVQGLEHVQSLDTTMARFMQFLVPFIGTPGNLARIGIARLTPFGIPVTIAKSLSTANVRRGKSTSDWYYESNSEALHDVVNNAISVVMFYALAQIVSDRDEDGRPWITGSGAAYSRKGEKAHEYRNYPPFSIRRGDEWFSYKRIDPFSTAIALMVDASVAIDDLSRGKKKGEVWKRYAQSLMNQFSDKTYMRAIGDLMIGLQQDWTTAGGRWASTWATGFSPAILRQGLAASDDQIRNYKPDADEGFLGFAPRRVGQRMLPIASLAPAPRRDPWGRPIQKPEGSPAFTWLGRYLSPFQQTDTSSATKLDGLINTWNYQNPNDQYYVSVPPRSVKHKGEMIDMNEAEYDRFLQRRGELIVQGWEAGTGWMKEAQYKAPKLAYIKNLERLVRRASNRARVEFLAGRTE
ncbi:MAG: hypothetical protein ACYTGH_09600, partial [Planctomycetota bacterium]